MDSAPILPTEEHPEIYQEDFMFMGGKAFAYYYSVIDSYLRETPWLPTEDRDDREAWILRNASRINFKAGTTRMFDIL